MCSQNNVGYDLIVTSLDFGLTICPPGLYGQLREASSDLQTADADESIILITFADILRSMSDKYIYVADRSKPFYCEFHLSSLPCPLLLPKSATR